MAHILVFWHDIIPTVFRAQKMQNTYDSVSRKVYFRRGTASVFDFNFSMIKTKLKAILERTIDASKPIAQLMDNVSQGVRSTRDNLELQKSEVDLLSVAMNQMGDSTSEIALKQQPLTSIEYLSNVKKPNKVFFRQQIKLGTWPWK